MSKKKLPKLTEENAPAYYAQIVVDRHPEYIEMFMNGKSVVDILLKEAMKENKGSCNQGLLKSAIIDYLSEHLLK